VLYQVAFGDNTVPNVTSGNIVRAGDLFDRTTYYRNDRRRRRRRTRTGSWPTRPWPAGCRDRRS
jgi:hypothetical protein